MSGWHLLTHLNLNENRLKELSLHDFPSLAHLELRANQLTHTSGINVPSLQRLYLAANTIEKIQDIEQLVHLNLLHLRDNKVEILDGLGEELKSLKYINLRGNKIASFTEIEKLAALPVLCNLVLLGLIIY